MFFLHRASTSFFKLYFRVKNVNMEGFGSYKCLWIYFLSLFSIRTVSVQLTGRSSPSCYSTFVYILLSFLPPTSLLFSYYAAFLFSFVIFQCSLLSEYPDFLHKAATTYLCISSIIFYLLSISIILFYWYHIYFTHLTYFIYVTYFNHLSFLCIPQI